MKKCFVLCSTLGLLLGLVGQVQAVSLADLFAGQSIQALDKVFSDFTLINEIPTDPLFNPNYALIDVTPLEGQALAPGIRFETLGQLTANDLGLVDVNFQFLVTSLGGAIKGNSLEINEFFFSAPGGLISIEENVFDAVTGAQLASKKAEVDNLFGIFSLFDVQNFNPTNRLVVDNKILIRSDGNFVSLDGFEQRFSQVPEPSTFLLLGGGLVGMLLVRRRAKKG
ncbi:MAG TPA: PEP-CTERM sorting domain-containing protein [Malonomonas sp.]